MTYKGTIFNPNPTTGILAEYLLPFFSRMRISNLLNKPYLAKQGLTYINMPLFS
jgi:hypothetical protein